MSATHFQFQSRRAYAGQRLAHVNGFALDFAFSAHSRERLGERFRFGMSDLLRLLPSGRVIAQSRTGRYVAEFRGGDLGDTTMLAVLAYPNHQDRSSVAVVTVYPVWDGDIRSAHLDIAAKYGCQMVRKRPVLEVLGEQSAR
jgi:hypothetical protein